MSDGDTGNLSSSGTGGSGGSSGGAPPAAEVKNVDLSSEYGHATTVEYVRNNVILPPEGQKPDVLQLEVKLPGDKDRPDHKVTLIMNTENHYILGFKGQDKIYLLQDADSPEIKKTLVKEKLVPNADAVEILKLGGEHPTLGTLDPKRSFDMGDLKQASRLGEYSTKNKDMTYDDLKKPLSLLVCMISESSRVKSMEHGMRRIYHGESVKASEAIQSWKDACGLIEMADKYFPKDYRWNGVERLEKRGTELQNLLRDIKESAGKIGDEKAFLQELLEGKYNKDRRVGLLIERVRDMARELNITNAGDVGELISATRNDIAVAAAKDGVVVPRTVPMLQDKKALSATAGGRKKR